MLRDHSHLLKSFQETISKSEKECGSKLEEIRELCYSLNRCFGEFMVSDFSTGKLANSLTFWCYVESTEISGFTLYLSYCGLYRNAFDNIRHILESMVQSVYIDINHPGSSLKTKLEILKEIEDKKEYHASRLLQEKLDFKSLGCEGLDCKGLLNTAYKDLSKMVHPSHEKVIATFNDFMHSSENKSVILVNCAEVSKIFDSLKIVFDIFYVLIAANFPEFKKVMKKDQNFLDTVEKFNLTLLKKVLDNPNNCV
jgi:hypothetical protein